MADDLVLNSGSGGGTLATDEIGSRHFPKGKTVFGADGTATDVTSTTGLPVRLADGSGYLSALPVTGTFWQATQPISAASLPLPSGAATESTLNAIGVLLAGGIPIAGTVTVGSHAVTNAGTFAVQVDGTALTRLTDIETNTDTLAVVGNGAAATAQRVTLANDGTGVLATVSTVTSLTQMNGQAIAMGTGTRSAGTQRVTIATDDVVPASQSGTWTVQPGDTANTTPWLVSGQAATAGGYSAYSFLSTAAVQAAQVKGSPGQVYKVSFFNNSATVAYVRLYNQTGVPGAGDAANILWRGLIPANTSGAGWVESFPDGLAFSTGIGIRVTAAVADNDNAALAANVILGNVAYK